MQNQATGKYFVQGYIWWTAYEYKWLCLTEPKMKGIFEWGETKETLRTLYFDTLEQAEAKIAEFKAEEEKKELLKNPKIIKYL
jgi:hypothetical protein